MSFDPREPYPEPPVRDALPADGVGANVPPEPLPPVAVRERPFPLHPGFWWALLWCGGLVLCTQVPAGVLLVVLFVGYLLLTGRINDPAAGDVGTLMQDPVVLYGMALGFAVAHLLIIGFSLLVLRIVAGRGWHREIALRLPSWSHLVLALLMAPAFVVFAIGVDSILRRRYHFPSMGEMGAAGAFLAALFVTLAVFGAASLVVRLVRGPAPNAREGEPFRTADALFAVVTLGSFVGLMAAAYLYLLPLFQQVVPPQAQAMDMKELERMIRGWPVALGVLVIAVFPGIGEELWCRGFLGRGLVGKYGYFWGVVLTSFLFGLIHLDPLQGTMAMTVGVILHYAYLMSRSLVVPMVLHFLNNGINVLLTRIPQAEVLERTPNQEPVLWAVYATAGLVLLATGVALFASRSRLAAPEGEPEWRPAHAGVACPPPWSTTRVEAGKVPPLLSLFVGLSVAAFAGSVAAAVMRVG